MLLLYLMLGGAAGGAARYALAGWIYRRTGADFPWGTLVVNLLGSFTLGLVLPLVELRDAHAGWRALLTVGFLGAFTTFSTFSYEAAMLLREGEWRRAAAYVLGSLGLGLAAIAAGFLLARVIARA